MARRMADLQETQLQFQMTMQERELALRERAQEMEFALRRLALDRADDNEKAANARLERADTALLKFARRGQTFAMWLAGGSTVALLAGGLVCIFLTVAGVITSAVGFTAAGLLLAAGLFTGIANLIKNFLPGSPGSSGDSGDKSLQVAATPRPSRRPRTAHCSRSSASSLSKSLPSEGRVMIVLPSLSSRIMACQTGLR
jgi:hypothetical protein